MEQFIYLNCAIDYIERNLTQPLPIEQVAKVVGYSRFHFDRLFLAAVGDTPASYLRKRRLTEAAREIVTANKSLLELTLDYQFQSQEAFTRSFKRMFGFSPGAYRRRRRLSRMFYKITLRPQKIFYLNGSNGPTKLILPRQGIAHILPVRTIALLTQPVVNPLRQQEIYHAHRFAPTQLYLALGGATAFHHR